MEELKQKTEFSLSARQPFDFYSSVESEIKVRRMEGYPPLVDHYDGHAYWTTLRMPDGRIAGLRIEPDPPIRGDPKQGLHVTLYTDKKLEGKEVQVVRATVTHCWGLDEDINEFYRVAKNPPLINRAVQRQRGMRKLSSQESFRTLCIAILLQNATLARTNAMIASIVINYGSPVRFEGLTLRHWPSPEKLSEINPAELKSECRLGYRAERLSTIAQAIAKKKPDLEQLTKLPSEEAKRVLVQLKGIGDYSAETVLLEMRRWDVFPVDVWSARQFYRVLFPRREVPPTAKALKAVRTCAEELWGRWRGLILTFVLHQLDELAEQSELEARFSM